MTPYERVRKSRELTAATFPLPSVLDCVRYAITELAEYDDALLRQERTGDKRNNDKAHDPRAELGQALYMLLSAAMQLDAEPQRTPLHVGTRIHLYAEALHYMAYAAQSIEAISTDTRRNSPFNHTNAVGHTEYVYHRICQLARYCNWDVDALIDDTCAAFEAKHAPREVQP